MKLHEVRYYLECCDAPFETKMAEVLCACREVAILKQSGGTPTDLAIICCDDKPGIQPSSTRRPICHEPCVLGSAGHHAHLPG